MGFPFRRKKTSDLQFNAVRREEKLDARKNLPVQFRGNAAPFSKRPSRFKKVAAGFGRAAFRGASKAGRYTGSTAKKGFDKGFNAASERSRNQFRKGHYGHCQKCGRPSGDYPLCKFHYNQHKLSRYGHFGKVK